MNKTNNPIDLPQAPGGQQVIRVGLIILIVFVGGFLLWGSLFPIESAAVASGRIMIESNRKTIQHLEEGIVQQIFVHEGQQVQAGQKLIQLDQTQALANLEIYQGEVNVLLARKAWLTAARDKKDKVVFPERLLEQAKTDPNVKNMMETAVNLFNSYNETLNDGIKTLNNRIDQSKSEIESLKAQVISDQDQLKLLNEELDAWNKLEEAAYIDKPKVLALKREIARLDGDKAQQTALIARAEQKITESQLDIINLINLKESDVLKELDDTEYNLIGNLEKETETKDILKRSVIVSPIEGTVLNLKVHTIGGVVAPHEPLMDIVPSEENVIVEARVSPQDIMVVRPGMIAKIRLTAYKQRHTPTLDGKVITISGDSLTDEKTNETYYLARLSIDQKQLSEFANQVQLFPGMPVQVLIIVDKRTPLQYLLKPVTDSFSKAFHEH